ncbi:unnamed protein product [Adineta steineri]|uniref:Uncharacterized protein n=1 Tax=Adineta steineri TaxID=433720 RepID=A0A818PUP7_9BILA|nr:unnamed protein product [Adineta steineri]CAF3631006.1 unnamed protein product [Adineta steineri]
MGCTNSKENTNPPTTTTITDNSQQLINDHFRKWLKSNRPKADEYVLNDILSTTQQPNDIDDYRPIVRKALDILSERNDIKTTNKLTKLVQKEVSLASPKKVARTIDVLKQTAEKLRQGQLQLDNSQEKTTTTNSNGEITNNTKAGDNKHGQLSSTEPGIVLKEALEKARISFYKGKQAAIFANPNGGYDVRIIDENDDTINQDGNLLRSIIVTEVKMRPKSTITTTTSPLFTAPPPPPPSTKVLDEHKIGDDFRRSIDAALKGLEAIYHTSPTTSSSEHTRETHIDKRSASNVTKPTSQDNTVNLAEIIHEAKGITNINDGRQQAISQTDIQPKLVGAVDSMNEIMLGAIESTSGSQIGDPIPQLSNDTVGKLVLILQNEDTQRVINETKEHVESLPAKQISFDSIGLTSNLQNKESITSSSTSNKENLNELTQTGIINSNSPTSITKFDASSDKIEEEESLMNQHSSSKIPTSISQIIEEQNKVLSESLPPVVSPIDMNTTSKLPSHNVTYTEIIHSESLDGEQSRRFITESYDEQPSKNGDDQATSSLKVITKSEFSNHPSLGEKIMEQSVQVISVKVRNETTIPSPTSNEKQSLQNDTMF